MTEELIPSGADIVKVGIGPGSVCTTGLLLVLAFPPSLLLNVSIIPHGLGGHIIADGGCTTPGDVAKAFQEVPHYVMLGGMLHGP